MQNIFIINVRGNAKKNNKNYKLNCCINGNQ